MAKPIEVLPAVGKNKFFYACQNEQCGLWRELTWYEPSNEAAKVVADMMAGKPIDDNDRMFIGPYCTESCLKACNYKLKKEDEDAGKKEE